MLAQLATLKARLALDPLDVTNDVLLLRAIIAVSARFDRETNRALARTIEFQQEFDARDTELIAACYPIESVSKFELKLSEAEGWTEPPNVNYLIRSKCVISLSTALDPKPDTCNRQPPRARVTYTGGYVLPGDPDPQPGAGAAGQPNPPQPVRLPADLEQAAVEQSAFWFQTRDKLGVIRQWPKGGSYEQLADTDLLPSVRAILKRYARLAL